MTARSASKEARPAEMDRSTVSVIGGRVSVGGGVGRPTVPVGGGGGVGVPVPVGEPVAVVGKPVAVLGAVGTAVEVRTYASKLRTTD